MITRFAMVSRSLTLPITFVGDNYSDQIVPTPTLVTVLESKRSSSDGVMYDESTNYERIRTRVGVNFVVLLID